MACKADDRMKRTLLLCFVVVSVALIISIYAMDLTGSSEPAPAFYRGAPTAAPAIQLTLTAPAGSHTGPGQVTPTPPHTENGPLNRTLDDA